MEGETVRHRRLLVGRGRLLKVRFGPADSAKPAGDDEITPLSRRGVRRLLMYAETTDHIDRAVERGLRASGRGITWFYSGSCK